MAGEELAALGRELRVQADAWLAHLLDGWALPGAEAAAEPLAQLTRLERDVVALAGQAATLDALASTLTAGFPGEPVPILPDVPVDEDADPDAARERRARLSASPPPTGAAERVDRQGGEGGSAVTWPPSTSVVADGRSADRGMDDASPPPSSAGGIRGLGDLAALAGSGGLDLPAERADSAPPPRRERRDGGWDDAPSSAARPEPTRQEGRWADADPSPRPIDRAREDAPRTERSSDDAAMSSLAPPPIRLPTWELPGAEEAANRHRPSGASVPSADAARGSDGYAQGDVSRADAPASPRDAPPAAPLPIPLPPRDRRDFTVADASQGRDADPASARGEGDRAASAEGRWGELSAGMAGIVRDGGVVLGGLEPGRIALPFLDPPDQPAADASAPDTASADEDRAGVPAGSREAQRGGAGREARTRGRDDGARLPPSIGRRIPPAAEILGALGETTRSVDPPVPSVDRGWPAAESASPAVRLSREAGANPPARAADEAKTVVVREADAGTRGALPEPPGWPELDVQDLMDALAREVMHEYRRHYGAG